MSLMGVCKEKTVFFGNTLQMLEECGVSVFAKRIQTALSNRQRGVRDDFLQIYARV